MSVACVSDSSLLSGNETDSSGDESSDLGGNTLKHCSGEDSEQWHSDLGAR